MSATHELNYSAVSKHNRASKERGVCACRVHHRNVRGRISCPALAQEKRVLLLIAVVYQSLDIHLIRVLVVLLAHLLAVQLYIHLAKQRVKRQVHRTNCVSIRQVGAVSIRTL